MSALTSPATRPARRTRLRVVPLHPPAPRCPRCRGELDLGAGRARCATCGSVFYANSVPTASALLVDEKGRLLLARRAHEPAQGLWDVPGGFLDEGEEPLAGLRRELREETGLEIEPLEFFRLWMDRYGEGDGAQATLNLSWTARVVGGEPHASDDVAELRWFAPDELPPPDEFAFHVGEVISAFRARHEHA